MIGKIVWRSDNWAWYGLIDNRTVYCVQRCHTRFEALHYRKSNGSAYRIDVFPNHMAAKAACEADAQSLKTEQER